MATQMIMVETPVPEDIYLTLQAYGLFREGLAEQTRRLLALRLYQDRVLSLGKATRLAGLDRWEFIDLLSDNKIPVIDLSDDELVKEFSAVDQLAKEIGK